MSKWSVSDISETIPMRSNDLEFQDNTGEWHHFTVIATPKRIVFEEYESLDESLQEMLEDLEVYYNDGKDYVSRMYLSSMPPNHLRDGGT